MTHEYVIAVGGVIESAGPATERPTAIAWAADRVLAVGPDEAVRSISRGDSTFLDLGGRIVTPLPADLARAEALVHEAFTSSARAPGGLGALLLAAGLLGASSLLEPGSPADLAVWDAEPPSPSSGHERAPALVAVVRGGAFTAGDARRGPFPPPGP